MKGCEVSYGDNDQGRCTQCGEALPPMRRRWCSERCDRIWQANHVWPAARAAALARTNGQCEVCRDPEDVEVHHDPPVGKHGYGHGCSHHQGAGGIFPGGLVLRMVHDVLPESLNHLRVFSEHPKARIARRAQHAPDFPRGVTVVYVRDDLSEAALANGARVPLVVKQFLVGLDGEPVVETQTHGPGLALLGAVHSVLARDPFSPAEEAHHRLLRGLPRIPGSTAGTAVEGADLATDEVDGALEAMIRERATIEGTRATEAGVVTFAELGRLPGSHSWAEIDAAGLVGWQSSHAVIVMGVAANEMPPARRGLHPLCVAHHAEAHRLLRAKPGMVIQLSLVA